MKDKDIKVSACIIAKNEEENLPRLLESIKGKFHEIVLVDTGSTDKTVEIAKNYGAKVFHREWNGFADARQYAVDMATGDWIWFFDADCELEEEEFERFKRILNLIKDNPEYEGIGVIYKNVGLNKYIKGYSSTVHIHKKHPDLVWEGKIHERIVNKNTKTILVPPLSVYVLHYGYSDFKTQIYKAKRNLKLIFDELKKLKPTDYEYYVNIFYILQSYNVLALIQKEKYSKKSLRYIKKFKQGLNTIPNESTFKRHFYVYAAKIYIYLNQLDKALETIEEGLKLSPMYPDFHYLNYEIFKEKKEFDKAIESGIKYLESLDNIKPGTITDYIFAKNIVIEDLTKLINESEDRNKFIDEITTIYKKEKKINIGRLLFNLIKDDNHKHAEKIAFKLAYLYNSDEVLTDLGKFYYKQLEKDKAKEMFLKAININDSNIEANKFMYLIYKEEGNLEQSFNYLKNYVLLSRNSSYIQEFLDLAEKLGLKDLTKKLENRLKNL